jgi:hypothetical protein
VEGGSDTVIVLPIYAEALDVFAYSSATVEAELPTDDYGGGAGFQPIERVIGGEKTILGVTISGTLELDPPEILAAAELELEKLIFIPVAMDTWGYEQE